MRRFGKPIPEAAVRFESEHAFLELMDSPTVLDAYDAFHSAWALPPNIMAEVNSQVASLDQIIKPNDYVEFVRVIRLPEAGKFEPTDELEQDEEERRAKKAAKAEKKARKRAKKFEKARQDLIELRKELG